MSEHRRQVKRYMAALRRDGACRFCIHGQESDGAFHCRNAPEKSHGTCMQSPSQFPRFQVVENVLEEFADGA